MNLPNRTQKWCEAGLISEHQAKAIVEFESTSSGKSWVVLGVLGIGVVAIATGIISVIASNWQAIPDWVKLTTYLALQAILCLSVVWANARNAFLRESLITLSALLILGGIGLVSQIYHLKSTTWQGILFWVVITGSLALIARSRMLPYIWFIALYLASFIWFVESPTQTLTRYSVGLTLLFLCLGLLVPNFGLFSNYFRHAGRNVSLFLLFLPAAIVANSVWASTRVWEVTEVNRLWLPAAAALVAAIAANLPRHNDALPDRCSVLFGILLLAMAVLIIPAPLARAELPMLGFALFLLPWILAGVIAAQLNLRRLYDFVALVIGIRLIVVYFEVFGSLAATGIGLIVSGVLILSFVYLWSCYRQKLAGIIKERL